MKLLLKIVILIRIIMSGRGRNSTSIVLAKGGIQLCLNKEII